MTCDEYVKIYSQSLDSSIWSNSKLWHFWTYCLLRAGHEERVLLVGHQEVTLMPGQFLFGRNAATKELPLTVKNIRTCIDTLRRLNMIRTEVASKYSIITIINWDTYKGNGVKCGHQNGQQTASKRPANGQQKHTREEIPFDEIIRDLNEKSAKDFSVTEAYKRLIKARWKDGHRINDFFTVNAVMSQRWGPGSEYFEYLRPQTLYGTKFDSYLANSKKYINGDLHKKTNLQKALDPFAQMIQEAERDAGRQMESGCSEGVGIGTRLLQVNNADNKGY